MPTATTLGRTPARRHDPLGPLADAIGSITGATAVLVAKALHQLLEATTARSRSVRLQLIRHLKDIECQTVGTEMPKAVATAALTLSAPRRPMNCWAKADLTSPC